jgi:uncharacterized membrane protein YbhN (UPF0104 family)
VDGPPRQRAAESKGGHRGALRAAAGLALGVAAALLVARALGISRAELAHELARARPGPLAAAAGGAIVLLALQAWRWSLVMRPAVGLGYVPAFQAMAVGFLFNVALPARGGDLLRVQYLGKRTGISRAKLLGTELVDFGCDKLGWLVAFPLLCLFGAPPGWIFRAVAFIGGFGALAVLVLVLMASRLGRAGKDGKAWGPRWLAELRGGFAVSGWKRLLAIQLAVAPLPWLWETAVLVWAGGAVGLALEPMQAFSVLTAFNVATAVPSPGNAGSFEAGGTLALTALGVPHDTALTFILLYHLTQVIPSCALGALVLAAQGERIFGARGLLHFGAVVPLAPAARADAATRDPAGDRAG